MLPALAGVGAELAEDHLLAPCAPASRQRPQIAWRYSHGLLFPNLHSSRKHILRLAYILNGATLRRSHHILRSAA